jgi:lysozyme
MRNTMYLSDTGRKAIKSTLKLYLTAYLNENKTPAIGYGITKYPDGLLPEHGGNVKMGDKISKDDADTLFDATMQLYEECVNNFIEAPLTQNQFDALVGICYTFGIENFLLHPALEMINNFQYREAIAALRDCPIIEDTPTIQQATVQKARSLMALTPTQTEVANSTYNMFLS